MTVIAALLVLGGIGIGGYHLFSESQFSISESRAKAIAIRDANLNSKEITRIKIEKDIDDGMAVYEIDLMTVEGEYEYTIDGKTGDIVTRDAELSSILQESSQESSSAISHSASAKLSVDEAKAKVLEDAGLGASEVTNMLVENDTENGVPKYDIEFDDVANKREYSYTVNAETGEITKRSSELLDNN
ncbi:PepSY domain-containing protein [Streptococcus pluranimalium]|uniref:PepSY domain-containing protein n=1 Tax=Streptococcus pluranimalium TaxID=82348 RepID=UPI0039FC7801